MDDEREAVEATPDAPHGALFTVLYDELRQLARQALRRRGPASQMSPTTVLHEVYLGLAKQAAATFHGEGEFLAYAAKAIRSVIVDEARERLAAKRGSQFEILPLPTQPIEAAIDDADLVRINDAIEALSSTDAPLAELVALKFFCGLSFAEIAGVRCASERTVQRDWERARVLLYDLVDGRAD